MKLRITFLGTGTSSGIPMLACPCAVCHSDDPHDRRLRCSALLDFFHTDCTEPFCRIVIDAGPDFRQQLLRENVSDLDAILLTHEHKDHIGGLDDVRSFNYFNQRSSDIYALPRVLKAVKREFAYAFAADRYPGVPEMSLHPVGDRNFSICGIEFVPIHVMHYKLPILGFRVGNFGYITDGSALAASEIEKLKGVKIFTINTIRREKHISHFSLGEALDIAAAVAAPRTYLTHLSHQIGKHRDLSASLPPGVQPAYDGLRVYTDFD